MVRQFGSHEFEFDKIKVGEEFEPLEFIVTKEMVERNAWANDDYNPWYMEDSPFGGRIASPTFLGMQALEQFFRHFAYPPGGAVHAKQEYEFINPIKVGKKYKMTGRIEDKYTRKGRDYVVSEHLVVDEDGVEIVRMKVVGGTPVVPLLRDKAIGGAG